MALGNPQRVTNAGIAPSYAVPLASEVIPWPAADPSFLMLHVKNANAAELTVTVTSQKTASDGLAVANKVVTVPLTTGDRIVYISQAFRSTTGTVAVAFSVQASVSAAVLHV